MSTILFYLTPNYIKNVIYKKKHSHRLFSLLFYLYLQRKNEMHTKTF